MLFEAIIKDGGIFIPNVQANSFFDKITVELDILEIPIETHNKFNKYFDTWKNNDDNLVYAFENQRKIDKGMWNV